MLLPMFLLLLGHGPVLLDPKEMLDCALGALAPSTSAPPASGDAVLYAHQFVPLWKTRESRIRRSGRLASVQAAGHGM